MKKEQGAVLITGSRRGLGRFLAESFLEREWTVIGCSRNETDLRSSQYHHFQIDIANEQDVVAMFAKIRRDFKRLDALVNNAGVAKMNPALLTPAASIDQIMRTNVNGTFLCSREAAKLMMKSGGRIINLSSVAVPRNLEGESVYAASKAAVESMTRVLAREFGGYGITVNAVAPNPIRTEMIANVPEDLLARLVKRQAIPRFGEFEDVLNVIDFFLNPASGLVTGQIIYLGGL